MDRLSSPKPSREKRKKIARRLKKIGAKLQELQVRQLEIYRDRLAYLATSLTADGCWNYYASHLEEARAVGVAAEFGWLVADAASKFKDGRIERITQTYSNRGR